MSSTTVRHRTRTAAIVAAALALALAAGCGSSGPADPAAIDTTTTPAEAPPEAPAEEPEPVSEEPEPEPVSEEPEPEPVSEEPVPEPVSEEPEPEPVSEEPAAEPVSEEPAAEPVSEEPAADVALPAPDSDSGESAVGEDITERIEAEVAGDKAAEGDTGPAVEEARSSGCDITPMLAHTVKEACAVDGIRTAIRDAYQGTPSEQAEAIWRGREFLPDLEARARFAVGVTSEVTMLGAMWGFEGAVTAVIKHEKFHNGNPMGNYTDPLIIGLVLADGRWQISQNHWCGSNGISRETQWVQEILTGGLCTRSDDFPGNVVGYQPVDGEHIDAAFTGL